MIKKLLPLLILIILSSCKKHEPIEIETKTVAYFFGDSQTYGTNGARQPYDSTDNRLLAKYRWPNILASNFGNSWVVNNYGVGSSTISYVPSRLGGAAVYSLKSHFNMTGYLPIGWKGVVATMMGWNNMRTPTPDTLVATMERAFESHIARTLIDGYAGISASMWDYKKTAGVNQGVTSGTNMVDVPYFKPTTGFTPFPTNKNTDPRFSVKLLPKDSVAFTLTNKRAIALFYETDVEASGSFDVYVNNIKVGSFNTTYLSSGNSTNLYPSVVWLENVPKSARVKMVQTGTPGSASYYLAYGWVDKTSSTVNDKKIITGSVLGNTANGHLPEDLKKMAIAAEQAAGAFPSYPVYFVNNTIPFNEATDQEPEDISHLTDVGNYHVAQNFSMPAIPKYYKSRQVIYLK